MISVCSKMGKKFFLPPEHDIRKNTRETRTRISIFFINSMLFLSER